jgi:hypothetical protein
VTWVETQHVDAPAFLESPEGAAADAHQESAPHFRDTGESHPIPRLLRKIRNALKRRRLWRVSEGDTTWEKRSASKTPRGFNTLRAGGAMFNLETRCPVH